MGNNTNPSTIVIQGKNFSLSTLLLIVSILVIGYLIMFNGNSDLDDNREKLLQEKIEKLEIEKNNSLRKVDSLENELDILIIIQNQLSVEDSIKQIEIDNQKKRTSELIRKREIAERERKEVEKILKDIRENPTKLRGSDLILDTEKRINK